MQWACRKKDGGGKGGTVSFFSGMNEPVFKIERKRI